MTDNWFSLGNRNSHQIQVRELGYAVAGETMEHSAVVAENGGGFTWRGFTWDCERKSQATRRWPWMSLPWVGEHCRRGHAPWPRI
jgi:hypothetical protein